MTKRTSPFALVASPSAEDFATALRNANIADIESVARLWLTEGIPWAFQDRPIMYEILRRRVARHLAVDPRAISLTGSARLGYSLTPGEKFGRTCHPDSDLDLFVVDEALFTRCMREWKTWILHATSLPTESRGPNAQKNLDDIARPGLYEKRLRRGFFDTKYMDESSIYPSCKAVAEAARDACRMCRRSKSVRVPRADSSIRVYRDWASAVRQIAINIGSLGSNCAITQRPHEQFLDRSKSHA